jgi:hypothetical protein
MSQHQQKEFLMCRGVFLAAVASVFTPLGASASSNPQDSKMPIAPAPTGAHFCSLQSGNYNVNVAADGSMTVNGRTYSYHAAVRCYLAVDANPSRSVFCPSLAPNTQSKVFENQPESDFVQVDTGMCHTP